MVRTMYCPTYIVKSAQNMRSRMTTAEGLLWKRLSNGFDGVRFRRQYAIGNHIVDFYCRKLRLIVEISRTGHPVQKERDAFLRACGYTVLRFEEKEILDDFPGIVSAIGLRIRLTRMKMRISTVKNRIRIAMKTAYSFFFPRRGFYAEADRRLKPLMGF
jgi:very-short-patch-repair endonuclease